MKRSLLMLGISLLVAGGLLSFPSAGQSAISDRAQALDQELIRHVQRQLKGLANPVRRWQRGGKRSPLCAHTSRRIAYP
jgi:hypothetical protein